MIEWLESLNTGIKLLIAISGGLLTLFGLFKLLGKRIKNGLSMVGGVLRIPDILEQQGLLITDIFKQLNTNGGSTLRDAVNRIEHRQCKDAEKIRNLLDSNDNAYFETDNNGHCIYVNTAYITLLQKTEKSCIGHTWMQNIHPEDRDSVYKEWYRVMTEKQIFDYKYRYLDDKDTSIPAHCKLAPIYDNNNVVIGWSGIIKKIPEIPETWQN